MFRFGDVGLAVRRGARHDVEGKLTLGDVAEAITEIKTEHKTVRQGFRSLYKTIIGKIDKNIKSKNQSKCKLVSPGFSCRKNYLKEQVKKMELLSGGSGTVLQEKCDRYPRNPTGSV